MGVIVFSVLLALGANEWRQRAARAATVQAVVETVRGEVVANRAEVERALAHHRKLLDQLRSGGIVMSRMDLRSAPVDTSSAAAFGESVTAIVRAEAAIRGGAPHPPFQATRIAPQLWLLESS